MTKLRTELTEEIVKAIYSALVAAGKNGLTRTEIYQRVCKNAVPSRIINEALFYEISLNGLGDWIEESAHTCPIERWYAKEFYPWHGKRQETTHP